MNMDVGRLFTDAEQALMDGIDAARVAMPVAGWVEVLQDNAQASFRESGLPHRRIEQWKYTDLRAAIKVAYPRIKGEPLAKPVDDRLADADFATITIENGEIVGEIPSIDGITIVLLDEAVQSEEPAVKSVLEMMPARGSNPVFDLNTVYMNHGFAILVAPGAKPETTLRIRSLVATEQPGALASRIAVVLGDGAELTLVETFEGNAAAFRRNAAIQAQVGDGAVFNHLRIESETEEAMHLSNIIVEIGADAQYNKFGLALGASLMRNDLSIKFNGEHSSATVDSVFLKTGNQHHDTTMYVDHAVPNCTSKELFKSVLGGTAKGVFQGKILVRPHAQKTDGKMSANAILLTDSAEMDAKPELEIFADDVVCGHGATAGQLDDDLLFFLRARGIPEREAKALLILAFIGEALEDVSNEVVHDHLLELTQEWITEADI